MAIEPYPSNEHLPTAYWFIGKYDNEFIKIDEEWKLLKTHIIAFTRTPYNEGWVQQPDARRIYHPNANPPQERVVFTPTTPTRSIRLTAIGRGDRTCPRTERFDQHGKVRSVHHYDTPAAGVHSFPARRPMCGKV